MTAKPTGGAVVSSPIPRENDPNPQIRDDERIAMMHRADAITDLREKTEAWKEIRMLFEQRIERYGTEELRPNVLRTFQRLCPMKDERNWARRILVEHITPDSGVRQWKLLASILREEEVPKELLELYLSKCTHERCAPYAEKIRERLEGKALSPFGDNTPSFLR